jgi:hypothetical protein
MAGRKNNREVGKVDTPAGKKGRIKVKRQQKAWASFLYASVRPVCFLVFFKNACKVG